MRRYFLSFCCLLGVAANLPAHADYWLRVSDASQLQYLIGPTKIWFRNLSQFDNMVAGCCYNYFMDLTTPGGQAGWTTILAKIQSNSPIWIYIYGTPTTPTQSPALSVFTFEAGEGGYPNYFDTNQYNFPEHYP